MNKTFDIANFLRKVKTSDFVSKNIPLEYTPGFPVVRTVNENTFLIIPFLKYNVTGVIDKTEVYPIRYVLTYNLKQNNDLKTVELPEKISSQLLTEGKMIRFEDLYFDERFADLQFDKPVGLFRHKAIKDLDKKAYNEKRSELFDLYNLMINEKLYGAEFQLEEHIKYKNLLRLLSEPSLKYMYKMIDEKFYDKYLK